MPFSKNWILICIWKHSKISDVNTRYSAKQGKIILSILQHISFRNSKLKKPQRNRCICIMISCISIVGVFFSTSYLYKWRGESGACRDHLWRGDRLNLQHLLVQVRCSCPVQVQGLRGWRGTEPLPLRWESLSEQDAMWWHREFHLQV